ncbi:MAG: hypothetical protein ACRD3M_17470 [Thermoanaerobaculia bacterium]
MNKGARGQRNWLLVVPPLASWLVAAGFGLLKRSLWLSGDYQPTLPLVSLPFEPRRDVVSSVPDLFLVLLAATVAVLLAEPAKAALAAGGRRLAYVGVVLYQLCLAADMVRIYAPDWWLWALSYVGVRELRENTGMVFPAPFPWVSAVVLIGVMTLLLLRGGLSSHHAARAESGSSSA